MSALSVFLHLLPTYYIVDKITYKFQILSDITMFSFYNYKFPSD